MPFQIDLEQLNVLFHHAEKTYPEECCGIILGRITDMVKVVLDLLPTENTWDEALAKDLPKIADIPARDEKKEKNFFIAPEEILSAQKEARNRNAIVLGFYHSHPDAPAIPSEFDRAIAWPDYSYLIVAIAEGKAKEVKSWQLDQDRKFQLENIKIIEK
ncbi:MAG: M67 family metallopeptidase [Cyanobacteria bacterium P01_E01_bin.42]